MLNDAKEPYMERACFSHCSCASRAFSDLKTFDLAETDATIDGAHGFAFLTTMESNSAVADFERIRRNDSCRIEFVETCQNVSRDIVHHMPPNEKLFFVAKIRDHAKSVRRQILVLSIELARGFSACQRFVFAELSVALRQFGAVLLRSRNFIKRFSARLVSFNRSRCHGF